MDFAERLKPENIKRQISKTAATIDTRRMRESTANAVAKMRNGDIDTRRMRETAAQTAARIRATGAKAATRARAGIERIDTDRIRSGAAKVATRARAGIESIDTDPIRSAAAKLATRARAGIESIDTDRIWSVAREAAPTGEVLRDTAEEARAGMRESLAGVRRSAAALKKLGMGVGAGVDLEKRRQAFKEKGMDVKTRLRETMKTGITKRRADTAAERREAVARRMRPRKEEDDDTSKQQECVRKVTRLCATGDVQNIQEKYELKRVLSGGKSGAYIFLVTEKRPAAGLFSRFSLFGGAVPDLPTHILKLYPDTYTDEGGLLNERPLREIGTLCSLNGIDGYPKVFDFGCTVMPMTWLKQARGAAHLSIGITARDYSHQKMPYVVMSVAKGVELSKLDLDAMADENLVGVLLQMLRLLEDAKNVLGDEFEHFDFHPDNIFVDVHDCEAAMVVQGSSIVCPRVNIIDFDLVNSSFFRGAPFSKELDEHTAKKEKAPYIPERTLAFAKKWLNNEELSAAITAVSDVENTDIRNWLMYLIIISRKIGFEPVLCEDVNGCFEKNYALFKKYISFLETRDVAEGTKISLQPLSKRVAAFGPAERTVTLLLGQTLTSDQRAAFTRLDKDFMKVYHHHVNQDNISLSVKSSLPDPVTFSFARFGRPLVDVVGQSAEIILSAKQSIPQVKVVFAPFLRVNVHDYGAAWTIAALAFPSLTPYGIGAPAAAPATATTQIAGKKLSLGPLAAGFNVDVNFFSPYTVHSSVGLPPMGSLYLDITSVSLTVDGEVLHAEVIFDVPEGRIGLIRAAAASGAYSNKLTHVRDRTYAFRIDVSVKGEPNACANYISRHAPLVDCRKYVNGLVMDLLKTTLDPRVFQAASQLGVASAAKTDITLQARSPIGAVVAQVPLEKVVDLGVASVARNITGLEVGKITEVLKKYHEGKLGFMDFISFIGRMWDATR